jgi:hypothetical protein
MYIASGADYRQIVAQTLNKEAHAFRLQGRLTWCILAYLFIDH